MNIEKIKVFLFILRKYPIYKLKVCLSRKERARLQVMNSVNTVDYIIQNKCSVARFGDGELQMISHLLQGGTTENFPVDTFQCYDDNLAKGLLNVLKSNDNNLLVCLPYQMRDDKATKDTYGKLFWARE